MPKGGTGPRATVGGRIAQARLRLGAERGRAMPQTELAGLLGVSSPTVSQWEADASVPALAMLQRLGKALGVSPAYLAFGETGDQAEVVTPNARKLSDAEIARARDAVVGKSTKRKRG